MPSSRYSPHVVGLAAMILSSVGFSGMAVLIGALAHWGVDPYLPALVRVLFGLAGVLAILAALPASERRIGAPSWVVLRGVTGGLAVLIFFLSIDWLGVGVATLINYTFPAFAALFSGPMLRERVGLRGWLAVAASVTGAGLIALARVQTVQGQETPTGVAAWACVALLGAASSGLAVVAVRRCRRTENSYTIFGSQCLFGLVFVLIGMALWPSPKREPSASTAAVWSLLLGIGALAMVSQLMMTYAFKPLTAVAGSLLMLITPCLNVVLGAVLFGERVSAVSVLGALLVLGSCASVTASSAEANAVPASD